MHMQHWRGVSWFDPPWQRARQVLSIAGRLRDLLVGSYMRARRVWAAAKACGCQQRVRRRAQGAPLLLFYPRDVMYRAAVLQGVRPPALNLLQAARPPVTN